MKANVRQIVLIGMFTAISAVLAQISFLTPFSPVPVTMQVFAVFLTASVIGSRAALASQAIYILLGAAGMPVFAGFESGIGILLSFKGGYLLSFPIMAFITGYIIEKSGRNSMWIYSAAMAAGLAFCYAAGTAWLGVVLGLSPARAVMLGIIPYIPADLLKLIAATLISFQIKKALQKARLL